MADNYQKVTDAIVRMLENGAGDWHMPWHTVRRAVGVEGMPSIPLVLPRNPISKTRYRGINVPMLWAAQDNFGYSSNLWATYKQWNEAKAQVRKGETGTQIVFWKKLLKSSSPAPTGGESEGNNDNSNRPFMLLKTYTVFNLAQVDGYVAPSSPDAPIVIDGITATPSLPEDNRIAAADVFFKNVGAVVKHGGNRAYYTSGGDFIQMPEFTQFHTPEDYYSTLGHEYIHYTGHESRCAREFGKRFGDAAYAFEELVAELGAAFLCAELQISNEPRPDHAAYVASWLRVLKGDNRAVFTAASKAQAAVDYLTAAAGEPAVVEDDEEALLAA